MSIDIEQLEAYMAWKTGRDGMSVETSPQAYARWLYDQENEEKLAELRALIEDDELEATNFMIEVSRIVGDA